MVGGLTLTIASSAAFYLLGRNQPATPETFLAYVGLPAVILGVLAASRGRDRRLRVVAAILVCVEAILAAAVLLIGLAYAVLFPLIGLALLLELLDGRPAAIAFAAAGSAAVAGIAVALFVGPASQAPVGNAPAVAVLISALLVTYTLGHLYYFNQHRSRAIESAQRELASRRAAEDELDKTTRLLAAIVDASPVPTQAFRTDGTVIMWNHASEQVFGWAADEVVGGRLPEAMTPEDDRADSADRIRRTFAGEVMRGERVRRLKKDGRQLWIDIYAGRLLDGAGEPIGVAGQLVDVTERVELEQQMQQTAKLEAMGGLAGGVAHDFNNILTAIRGYAYLARQELPDEARDARADLDEVVASADRAASLVRQLLAFARRSVQEPRDIRPAVLVEEVSTMLSRVLGEHIELKLEIAPDTGSVRMDPTQLEQVILNLAVNARDAMPAGGSLTISTSNVELDGAWASSHPDMSAGPGVLLSVKDTGTGMDEATRGRIFEPFFTTKEPGRGTGMGLATVFGIVRMAHGAIEVDSGPGLGTEFRIYLPRLSGDEPGRDTVIQRPGALEGDETVLIVEDDPAVLEFGRRCLEGLGYNVLKAANGQQAMRVAEGHPGPIHLLVTDVIMPGLQGPELAARLSSGRPGLRTIFCSGFAAQEVLTPEQGRDALVAKPYTRESLGLAVRAALDRPG